MHCALGELYTLIIKSSSTESHQSEGKRGNVFFLTMHLFVCVESVEFHVMASK